MNIKKMLAMSFLAMTVSATVADAAEFRDTKGHWAEEVISSLADKGILHGISDTEFNPDGTVTRAEFLKMTLSVAGIEENEYRSGECLDVTASDWYGNCLQTALDRGLIPEKMIGDYAVKISETDGKAVYSGYFEADKPILREEMSYIVYSVYQYTRDADGSYDLLPAVDLQFDDVSKISIWAFDGVRYAYANGLISGMEDDTFRPKETATRAQAASIINRLLEKM